MSQPEIPPFISELTGPLFLGILFNWALFGALSVQVYIYYLAFPGDRRFPSKALVLFVYVYEAIQTFLITSDGFKYFGSGWGSMTILNEVGLVWVSVPLMTGFISAVTQIFYAWRIYILSKQFYIPIVIVAIALTQGAAGIWNSTEAHKIQFWSDLQKDSTVSVIIWLAGTAVCDIIIAAAMLWYLSRSRTGFKQTNALIVKLIRITIETGFVTASVATIDVALYLAYKDVNYHLAPAISLSKLYGNSLMALMNARVRFVGGRNTGAGAMPYDSTLGQTLLNAQAAQLELSIPHDSSFHETWNVKPGESMPGRFRSGSNAIPLDPLRGASKSEYTVGRSASEALAMVNPGAPVQGSLPGPQRGPPRGLNSV